MLTRWIFVLASLCTMFAAPRFAGLQLLADDVVETNAVKSNATSLLRKHCAACHGPDVQESELRLDSLDRVLVGGQSGAIIDRDQIGLSALVQRIKSTDKDTRMPPEGTGLSDEEIATIENWIKAGLPWTDDNSGSDWKHHWSYQPLAKPALPPVNNKDWVRNPIDAFVLARLESEGYAPSPIADSRTLLRRLSLDLVGLPPSPEESSNLPESSTALGEHAYQQWVEQRLGSPLFGERWARHWLDVVRFAESDGFETNQPRPNAWPYRDYVIRAFNEDKPYDQFVREQLIGDQLGEDAATGFLVGGAWDRVKSPDPVLTSNQRADELHDMVSTTGATFLGLTVGCARCHSHKFDPISQRDYYAIKACLAGVQHGDRPVNSANRESRVAQAQSIRSKLALLDSKLAALEAQVQIGKTTLVDDSSPGFMSFKKESGNEPHAAGAGQGERDQSPVRFGFPNVGKQYRWWQADANELIAAYSPKSEGKYRVWISWGAGWDSHATDARYILDEDGDIATTEDQHEIASIDQRRPSSSTDAGIANRSVWSGFRDIGVHRFQADSRLLLKAGKAPASVTADVILLEQTTEDSSVQASHKTPYLRPSVNSQLNIENIAPASLKHLRFNIEATTGSEPCIDELMCFDTNGNNVAVGVATKASSTYPNNAFHQLKHINDGILGNEKSWISNEAGKGWVELEFPEVVTISRIRWSRDGSASPKYADRVATKYTISGSVDGATWVTLATDQDRLSLDYPHKIGSFQRYSEQSVAAENGESIDAMAEQRQQWLGEIAKLEMQDVVYAGRFEQPQPTPRLHRGDPMQPREPIQPGCLENYGTAWTLPPEAPESERRKSLADWIASPSNPLTARVIVNRLWHYHFGVGLVETPSDLGINGAKPSHPQLLDWLASELIEHGWSLKHIHRLIVESATYRQSSALDPSGKGPSDRLLGRFPSRRLEAESLRDSLLSVVGTLRIESGGVGFDLFEPNTNYVKVYDSKSMPGPDTWRRMVYQSKPRMQLENNFGSFDCPDAGQSSPKRNRSVTPLQALSMFNSPFMSQQADLFAKRLVRHSPVIDDQIEFAFQLAYSRLPDDDERKLSMEFVQQNDLVAFCRAILNSTEWMVIE